MSEQVSEDDATESVATRLELSFPADIGKHGRKRINSDYYKTYLKKVHDSAEVGDEWDEFTDVGCCGSKMDVPLVVERVVTESPRQDEVGDADLAVEGGARIDSDTEIEYTEREACGVNPGWSVQHDEPEALDD
ncbi:hypothetical protein [Halosimplex amylolyticum]|uniref:hypothetical protein n=1 Tax=Halosimplex amylolyticum TaxID=3396616 RepID=UPI003F578E3B